MSDPLTSGELVVRNGKHRGRRMRLNLPVTVIGQASRCDIRLTADGVGDVHCMITATASGPTLRSWCPEQTLVNGRPTAAALLTNGDEILVGPCLFQLAWHVEELIPLVPAGPGDPNAVTVSADEFAALRSQAAALVAQQAMLTDGEWQIREREQALNEQEVQLAATLEERQRQTVELQRQLTEGREQLRLDREQHTAAIAAEEKELRRLSDRVRPLHRQAHADRQRARVLLSRFFKHMKRRWSAERLAVHAERADLARCRREYDEQASRFQADQARFAVEAAGYQARLRDAWELLNEGQRRLLADRQQAERVLAERTAVVNARHTAVEAREGALSGNSDRIERHVGELRAEVERLEVRATRAREVLGDLERKRSALEADGNRSLAVALPDAVPLDRRADGSVEQILTELHLREREVATERRVLAAARSELERQAAALNDERCILAEQVTLLTVARDRWQDEEREAVVELEAVARAVEARELALTAKEHELADTDRRHRRREEELVQYRVKLDGWQSSLAAHEAAAAAARDNAANDLTARQRHLERWQAALTTLCRKWSDARRRDRESMQSEIGRWAAARGRHLIGLTELDRKRNAMLADAAVVAANALAIEQSREELTHGHRALPLLARRRLRVLQRKWERHFVRFRTELEARLQAVAVETASIEERYADLHRVLAEAAERSAALTQREQMSEGDRIATDFERDGQAVVLSIESARAARTERALVEVREEVERVAAAVMNADARTLKLRPADSLPSGVVALRPVSRAA